MRSTSRSSLFSSDSRRSLIYARGESFSQRSHRLLCVGLQIEKLEALLTQTASEFCEDKVFRETIQRQFVGLAARKHFRNDELTRPEMSEIVDILNLILASSPQLRPKLVAYVHSTIGLVRQLMGEDDSAIGSLTKALWIETSIKKPDAAEIGLTVHRLGISHGRNRNYSEALVTLKKSLVIYQLAGLDPGHPYVTNVIGEIALVEKSQNEMIDAASANSKSRAVEIRGICSLQRKVSKARAA